MWYWIIPLVGAVVLIAGIGGWNILSAKAADSKDSQKPLKSVTNRTFETNRLLTRDDIRQKLMILAQTPIPDQELCYGAECYEVADPPERAEYVCPVDGEKTIYTENYTEFLEWELPVMRSEITRIRGIRASLDDTSFCKKCHPGETDPAVYLVIKYANDDKEHRIKIDNAERISLIRQFLEGKLLFSDSYDSESPMKERLIELQKLLDVEMEPKIYN